MFEVKSKKAITNKSIIKFERIWIRRMMCHTAMIDCIRRVQHLIRSNCNGTELMKVDESTSTHYFFWKNSNKGAIRFCFKKR